MVPDVGGAEFTGMSLSPEQQALADKLTHLQRMTVINHIQGGMSQREAYRAAGGKAKSDNSADATAAEILGRPKVKAFYDSLISEVSKNAVMTREEAMETLSKIARTNVKDVVKFRKARIGEDENGDPVYQTVWEMKDDGDIDDDHAAAISELSAGRDGFKFKLHSQVNAIKQLAELEGWEAPKKVQHSGRMSLDANVSAPEVADAVKGLLDKL